jgi:hypothetical protein
MEWPVVASALSEKDALILPTAAHPRQYEIFFAKEGWQTQLKNQFDPG